MKFHPPIEQLNFASKLTPDYCLARVDPIDRLQKHNLNLFCNSNNKIFIIEVITLG